MFMIVREPYPSTHILQCIYIPSLLITEMFRLNLPDVSGKMHPIFKRMNKFENFSWSHSLIVGVNVPLINILPINSFTVAILDQLPQGLTSRLDTNLSNRSYQHHSCIQMNREKMIQGLQLLTRLT